MDIIQQIWMSFCLQHTDDFYHYVYWELSSVIKLIEMQWDWMEKNLIGGTRTIWMENNENPLCRSTVNIFSSKLCF